MTANRWHGPRPDRLRFQISVGSGSAILNNAGDASIGGNLFQPFLGGIGTLFGLPPSQLSLLQSRGKSKLLHKTQIHVLDGGENETKVGRSVPVRLGTQNFGGNGGFSNIREA